MRDSAARLIAAVVSCLCGEILPIRAEPATNYVIVTTAELADAFAALAQHRKASGYDARVVVVTDIAAAYPDLDLPAAIRARVRDAGLGSTHDVLVIGGDQDIVPARLCKPRSDVDAMPTDLYFADMGTGTWDDDEDGVYGESGEVRAEQLSPFLAVGRIPVRTPAHVQAYLQKVLRYENACTATPPASLLLLGGGTGITGMARPGDFRYHESVGDREIAQMSLYRDTIQPLWHAGPLHWFFESASTWDQTRYGDTPLTRSSLAERLNGSYLYVSYSGHANRKRWFIANGFGRDDLLLLTNSVPFINLPGGCGTCYHDDGDDPCMSEAALRNPHGGAVAWFGFVRSSSGAEQRERLIEHVFGMPGATLGQAHAAMLRSLASAAVRNPYNQFNIVLHGDPALRLLGPPAGRHIDLFCPRGAEIVATGDALAIRWNAWGSDLGPAESACLQYSTNGTEWQTVPGGESVPLGAGMHVWQTAGLPGSDAYRIRLTSVEQPTLSMTSQPFRIAPSGLLTVRAEPVPALKIGGTHGYTTDYDISVPLGDTAQLRAPTVPGVQFTGWRDGGGQVLSTSNDFGFVFTGDCTRVAGYAPSSETYYYVNDDIPEYGIGAGADAHDGLTPLTPMRSIQALLDRYPSAGYGAVVYVSEGVFDENLVLAQSHAGLVLRGAGRTLTIIDGGQRGSCLDAQAWQVGRVEHLGFENGLGMSHGGAIQMSGAKLTVVDCFFGGNTAQYKGGAIYTSESWAGDDLTVVDSEFVDNNANRGGVLFAAKSARIAMSNCTFRGNYALGSGAFQLGVESSAHITDCLFENNQTPDTGGAIEYYSSGDVDLKRCTFAGNEASVGGAIYAFGTGRVVADDCDFAGNQAESGGVVFAGGGNVLFSHSLFSSNHADKGGVCFTSGSPLLMLESCRLMHNTAARSGVLRLTGTPTVRCADSLFDGNSANLDGGVANCHNGAWLELTRCTLTNNWSDSGGALRILNAATCRATDCLLAGNRAAGPGGAVYVFVEGNFEANGCTIADNQSTDQGGALAWDSTGSLKLVNTILYGNVASLGSDNTLIGSSGTVDLMHLCSIPMPTTGFGHITNAPAFVDAAAGDFRLQPYSCCINAGMTSAATGTVDLAGNLRVFQGTVDIGCHEIQEAGSRISYAWLLQHGLPTDGSADHAFSDSDPLDNWQEWIALTDPRNGDSCFRIASLAGGPSVNVECDSACGRRYTLQVSTNLLDDDGWSSLPGLTCVPGTGGRLQMVHSCTVPRAYYRVKVALP